jgi:hypothetical protein
MGDIGNTFRAQGGQAKLSPGPVCEAELATWPVRFYVSLPFRGHNSLGGAVQVLLEAQLKGLAHGADDALGKALTALKDMAGWGEGG